MTSRITDMSQFAGVYQQMRSIESYLATSAIEPSLRHLVKLRVSQINGCANCMVMHAEEALKDGERVDRLSVLPAWEETEWFSDREKAALRWAETLTTISTSEVTDEIFAEVREQLSEKELADLTMVVIAINGWNRLAVPFRAHPKPFDLPQDEEAAAD